MSNFHPRHPEEAALVRFVDGELPPAEAREMEQHLEACPLCRAEVEELRATVAECIRYREDVLHTMLPAPPAPWADLGPEFARIDRELGQAPEERWWRMGGWSFRPALRWALAAALALVVVCGIFYQLRETPSVQAASLLHKAEIAAYNRPAEAPRRVLIRTRNAQFTRVIRHADIAPPRKEPPDPAVEALFQAAHWDWNDPLSAQAFADWRTPLEKKTDSVTSTADTYQIRTVTSEGELAAASLTLRAADLEPIEGRLEFRNQDWVELSEVAEGQTQDDGSTVAPHAVEPPVRRAEPSRPAAVPSGETVSVSSELQVLAALHGIGADLGEQLPVTPVDGGVVVSGVGIPPARQREIEAALEKFPNVTVQFSEPGAPAPVGAEPPAVVTAPTEISAAGGIAARVGRQLGGRPQFERFSSQMLDWNDAAMARAYALRRLAERFPASAEASLSAADRRTLREMAREHAAALAGIAAKMTRTLEPVLTALGGQNATRTPAPEPWQPAAEDLLRTAQRVERRLSAMLGAAAADGAAFSPSELLGDLGRLEDDIARCQRLLAQE
ncbi:MAG: zf-HC2 domain-containing protein [Bryobacteraceae bacterium]